MNRKGFTLIEMIVTIVVLALLITIATISTKKILNNYDEKQEKINISSYESAALDYAQDNKYEFNCAVGEYDSRIITLEELESLGYLKNISKELYNKTVTINFNCNKKSIETAYLGDPKGLNYATDGMLLWYDGINNNGSDQSHSNNITTWKDLSGNGNNGMISGATWGNNYLLFDGTNDYVQVAKTATVDSFMNNGNLTIEIGFSVVKFWTPSTSYPWNVLVDLKWASGIPGRGMLYHLNGNNRNNMSVQGRCYTSGNSCYFDATTSALSTNVLTSSSVTLDYTTSTNQTTTDIFINNNLAKTISWSSKVYNNTSQTIFLGKCREQGYYANVKIYYIRIYNRALSKKELNNNYLLDKAKYNF